MARLQFFGNSFSGGGSKSRRLEEIAEELLGFARDEELSSKPRGAIRALGHPERSQLVKAARETQRLRRLRARYLPKDYFGEAAWDILLSLYVQEDSRRVSISSVAEEAGTALTTVLRWISHLEGKARLSVNGDPSDARVRLLRLTDEGRQELDDYFREVLRTTAV